METHKILKIYKVTPIGNIVAVDFLRQGDTGRYRVLKYFYKQDWQRISKTREYEPLEDFDSRYTTKEIHLC